MSAVVLGVIAAVGALAQLYQSEKARGATQSRLDDIKRQYDKIKPPNYDVSIQAPPDYITQTLDDPKFDMRTLTPEQFKVVQKYSPDIAPYVVEEHPELAKQTAQGKEGRQAQLAALRKMRSVASSEFNPELEAQLSQASRTAGRDAQSRIQNIISSMQRRGVQNSGLAATLQAQAGADAAERQASAGQNAAAEAYRQRLGAIRESGSMGAGLAQSEQSQANRNADVINDYNQRLSRNRQTWENQRAQTGNAAQQYNIGAAQNVANMNVENTNKYGQANQQRSDDLAKYNYGIARQNQEYVNAIREKRANWQGAERDRLNKLAQQQFDDQNKIALGRQGVADTGMKYDYQTAADRNKAISGATSGAMNAYTYDAEEEARKKRKSGQDENQYDYS